MANKFVVQRAYFKTKQNKKVKNEDLIDDEILIISFINIEELGMTVFLRNRNYQKLTGHKELKQAVTGTDPNDVIWYNEDTEKLYSIKELHTLVCRSGVQQKVITFKVDEVENNDEVEA